MSDIASAVIATDGADAACSRRSVLAAAAAAAGLAALGPLTLRPRPGIHLAITDPRFTQSRLFVLHVGPVVHRIDAAADLCRQWYESLRGLAAGRPFAGLTTWIDFIVLQGCAREDGFVCRRRVEYAPASRGEVRAVSALFVPRGY